MSTEAEKAFEKWFLQKFGYPCEDTEDGYISSERMSFHAGRKSLEQELSEARKVIEFYASEEAFYKDIGDRVTTMRSIRYDDTETDDSQSHWIIRGGKRAREFLAKWEGKEV